MEKRYFKLQLKSIFKIFPTILLITALTLGVIGTVGGLVLKKNLESEQKMKINVGVVGNLSDTYLDIGLNVLKNVDDTRFYIDIIPMEEEEAIKKLKKREISGYLHVPDNYIENIYSGENTPAKYITLNSPTGFGSIISDEVAMMVSDIVIESQNGMYSMQTIAKKYNDKDFWANVEKLMLSYMDEIMSRHKLYEIQTLGITDNLSFGGYYFCGIITLLMLFFGISASRIFTMKNSAYGRLLKMSGMKGSRQILCEYGAYLIISVITLLMFATVFGIVIENNSFGIPELENMGLVGCIAFVINILPVIIMITMMQMAIYELIPNIVGSVLAQFLTTIFLGYLSGCFYPNYFFPQIIQDIALYLPVGAGFAFMRGIMSGEAPVIEFLTATVYILVFAFVAVKMRNNKITGDVR